MAPARELLEKFGSLQGMMAAPLNAWDDIKGVKGANLAQLQAALEIGWRAAQPSDADHRLTRNLLAACRPLGLVVSDHVIVTDAACFGFADRGLLDE